MFKIKNINFLFIVSFFFFSCKQKEEIQISVKQSDKAANLTDYVNPLMGTDSSFDLSNGNTYAAIVTP